MGAATMRLKLLAAAILLCTFGAVAQTDPLNAAYKPSQDCNPADYASNVALSGPLIKLQQQSGSPSTIEHSSPCVTIYATQNEFQPFQAHVQAPTGGYSALSIAMSALSKTTGPGGSYTIPAPDATHNDIVVYREGYIHVSTITASYATYYGTTGYYPDPLIPAIDPYYHQSTAAFPVAVTANQNQSALIDVYIPQAAPSGWYAGTVTISNSSTTIATLPVLYAVWQWPSTHGGYMPSTPTLKSNIQDEGSGSISWYGDQFYTSGNLSSYPHGLQGAEQDQAVLFLDHRLTIARFSCTPYSNSNCGDGSGYSIANYYGSLENGTDPTYLNSVSRIMPGSKLGGNDGQGPSGMCSGSSYGAPGTGSACQTKIANFESNWSTNSWLASPPNGWEDYIQDEPSSCTSLQNGVTNAGYTRGYTTPNIPILLTDRIGSASGCGGSPTEAQYENSVDIFVVNDVCMDPIAYACSFGSPAAGNQRANYNVWLSGNCCSGTGPTRQVWGYESNSADGGTYANYHIDGRPVPNAAEGWNAIYNQESGILYYAIHILWGSSDSWSSAYYEGANGDGTLIYPCSNSTLITGKGSANCGVAGGGSATPIFVPSIRLELMRDSIEDYEYMTLLNTLGGTYATTVSNAVASWFHGGYCFNVDPLAAANDPCGNTSTSDITDARISMGTAMQAYTYGANSPPAPANTFFSIAAKDVKEFLEGK
jgi:hypothetical protein